MQLIWACYHRRKSLSTKCEWFECSDKLPNKSISVNLKDAYSHCAPHPCIICFSIRQMSANNRNYARKSFNIMVWTGLSCLGHFLMLPPIYLSHIWFEEGVDWSHRPIRQETLDLPQWMGWFKSTHICIVVKKRFTLKSTKSEITSP